MEQNQGYTIKRAILYDNDRGFALGHNPAASDPFVTWQFTEEHGKRDYYWGRYFNTEGAAVKSFLERTHDYEQQYVVKMISDGPKVELYKYYSTQRPVDIGTYPKSPENPLIGFTNYDQRIPVEGGAFRAWGELTYATSLTEKEAAAYEFRSCPENPDLVARQAARAHKAAKHPPIAVQMKQVEKLAGENRAQHAPKKDAPDKGDR